MTRPGIVCFASILRARTASSPHKTWLVALTGATALPCFLAPHSAVAASVAPHTIDPVMSASRSIRLPLLARNRGSLSERHEERRARRLDPGGRTRALFPRPREGVLGALHDVQRLARKQRQRAAALSHL